MLKIALFAPIPSPIVRRAMIAKPGRASSLRLEYFKSAMKASIGLSLEKRIRVRTLTRVLTGHSGRWFQNMD